MGSIDDRRSLTGFADDGARVRAGGGPAAALVAGDCLDPAVVPSEYESRRKSPTLAVSSGCWTPLMRTDKQRRGPGGLSARTAGEIGNAWPPPTKRSAQRHMPRPSIRINDGGGAAPGAGP